MTKAVTYVRVSNREQQELDNSLGAQKRFLWELARDNSYRTLYKIELIGYIDYVRSIET